jgi:SnoaL-like domain
MQDKSDAAMTLERCLRSFGLAMLLLLCAGVLRLAAQTPQEPSQEEQPPASGPQPLTLTEQVIRDVLQPLQRGIEEHNRTQVLAVFDPEETPDFAQLRDQFRAFFDQYETVRFRYKVLQVTSEKDHGSAIAEVDMEATPMDETKTAVQRSTQMSFQLKLEDKGWKLVGFKPGDFFTQ